MQTPPSSVTTRQTLLSKVAEIGFSDRYKSKLIKRLTNAERKWLEENYTGDEVQERIEPFLREIGHYSSGTENDPTCSTNCKLCGLALLAKEFQACTDAWASLCEIYEAHLSVAHPDFPARLELYRWFLLQDWEWVDSPEAEATLELAKIEEDLSDEQRREVLAALCKERGLGLPGETRRRDPHASARDGAEPGRGRGRVLEMRDQAERAIQLAAGMQGGARGVRLDEGGAEGDGQPGAGDPAPAVPEEPAFVERQDLIPGCGGPCNCMVDVEGERQPCGKEASLLMVKINKRRGKQRRRCDEHRERWL